MCADREDVGTEELDGAEDGHLPPLERRVPVRGTLPQYDTLSASSLHMTTTDTDSMLSGGFNRGPFFASPGKALHGEFVFPIQGYEVMEARSKFTIFKMKVQHVASQQQWFVFRRYTDFARLNKKLRLSFPGLRLALPPKRWFGDNFDPCFLEDRMLGLQAFVTNITSHPDISRHEAVRQFFCLDEPPDPRDSLEESRLLCESLEETAGSQELLLKQRDLEIARLRAQLAMVRQQYDVLVARLRSGRRPGSAGSARRRLGPLLGVDGTQSASQTDLPGSDSDGREPPLAPLPPSCERQ
ncbi:Sorting nexin-16 [Amphibalanus amphitrite]|uniref:Sorting nexin-16 n=2 Tax=Amphibalanus amphitrite TaxID=1232801 RepID=A0A6A4XDF8_AMPAM|nr:sorting nexin-16-like [Amphibalanus amphitrite]XP_043188529.1 sorting nexin-16-like [Amphibalanus amphitrite]KAF0293684.1 Sorting nexin-16 [Amphibalanus amphitrite]KAF0314064.1 Sorting nexin-16 [Amphibalanus amphitrite]